MRRYSVFATDETHLDVLLDIVHNHGIIPTGVWRHLFSFEIATMTPALLEALTYELADIEEDESNDLR